LQGDFGLNQQAFALVFAAGAIVLIGATQSNVVLLRRFSPQLIMLAALIVSVVAAVVFVVLAVTGVGGLAGFLAPVLVILGGMGLVLPNAPAVALSRHHEAAGTAAALLGAAQFGLGAVTAPVVGLLGNNEFALAVVMLIGSAVALAAMVFVGVPSRTASAEATDAEALAEPA
jgi:MFS transporter, DHA1 family, multidrug resistance protein